MAQAGVGRLEAQPRGLQGETGPLASSVPWAVSPSRSFCGWQLQNGMVCAHHLPECCELGGVSVGTHSFGEIEPTKCLIIVTVTE